jgi:nitrite reductase/ring-hydroxylating ferredoxin subunit
MENSTNPAINGTNGAGTGGGSDGPWTELCAFSEVPDGEGIQVTVDAQVLAVWRVGQQAFVTDDTCTHGEASLACDGMLDGFSIVCGLHQGEFDIRTGLVLAAPCSKPIASYPACVKDGHVLAKLERVQPS